MHRRRFVQAAGLCLPLLPAAGRAMADDPADWLAATPYIDHQHPAVREVVQREAPPSLPAIERAVRLHDFVRDGVPFGWSSAFYDEPASGVLTSGVGFCNTKGTLFTALLRAAGIPARQHFVDIDARILHPFIDPGTAYVDHSFTEVHLDGRWWQVDSYIVDTPLARSARRRLTDEGLAIGYGLHADGRSQWDGRSDAFAQYVQTGRVVPLGTRDHGVHADVGAFYASGAGVNRLNGLLRIGFGLFAWQANRRIEALRGRA